MASRPGGVEEFDPPVKTMNKASEYTGSLAPARVDQNHRCTGASTTWPLAAGVSLRSLEVPLLLSTDPSTRFMLSMARRCAMPWQLPRTPLSCVTKILI